MGILSDNFWRLEGLNLTQFKISDYETIKDAMVNRDLKQALYDEGKVIMDGVLLTLHGEEHHKRRKLEHKVFQRDYFKLYPISKLI